MYPVPEMPLCLVLLLPVLKITMSIQEPKLIRKLCSLLTSGDPRLWPETSATPRTFYVPISGIIVAATFSWLGPALHCHHSTEVWGHQDQFDQVCADNLTTNNNVDTCYRHSKRTQMTPTPERRMKSIPMRTFYLYLNLTMTLHPRRRNSNYRLTTLTPNTTTRTRALGYSYRTWVHDTKWPISCLIRHNEYDPLLGHCVLTDLVLI